MKYDANVASTEATSFLIPHTAEHISAHFNFAADRAKQTSHDMQKRRLAPAAFTLNEDLPTTFYTEVVQTEKGSGGAGPLHSNVA